MHGSAFREAVGEWFNSTFLAGVSSIDFIWNIWTYSAHKSSKKGSCYSLQMYWDGGGGQSKLEPQPNRLSSYQSVTKHSSLSPDNIFWKETALWAPLSSSLRCGMNSKSIWNLIQDFYWDSDNQPAFTPLWCTEVPCWHTSSPSASLAYKHIQVCGPPRSILPRCQCVCYLPAISMNSHLPILHCCWLIVCWLADSNR